MCVCSWLENRGLPLQVAVLHLLCSLLPSGFVRRAVTLTARQCCLFYLIYVCGAGVVVGLYCVNRLLLITVQGEISFFFSIYFLLICFFSMIFRYATILGYLCWLLFLFRLVLVLLFVVIR